MVIFISGSINSGKTTTAKVLAKRLGGVFIDVDDLKAHISNFDLSKDIPKIIEIAIEEANKASLQHKPVVLSYVIRQKDRERIMHGLQDKSPLFITLAPKLHIAQSNRGGRELSEWEMERIKYHYDTSIASPSFGEIIDNSDMTVDQTVAKILDIVLMKKDTQCASF